MVTLKAAVEAAKASGMVFYGRCVEAGHEKDVAGCSPNEAVERAYAILGVPLLPAEVRQYIDAHPDARGTIEMSFALGFDDARCGRD